MFTIFNDEDIHDSVDISKVWNKTFTTERGAKTQITRYKNKHGVQLGMIEGTLEDNFEKVLFWSKMNKVQDIGTMIQLIIESQE